MTRFLEAPLTPSLIHTASIAYGREPAFGRLAPHQPNYATAIANVVSELPGILEDDRLAALRGEKREVKILEWGGVDPSAPRMRSAEKHET